MQSTRAVLVAGRASRLVVAGLFFWGVAGCAAPPSRELDYQAQLPVMCGDAKKCARYMERAQVWLAQNSFWRLQMITPVLLQTFGPGGSRVELAYSVTRTNDTDGSAQIFVRAHCDNVFGCRPHAAEGIHALKTYMINSD
jgi:hypothetical protein